MFALRVKHENTFSPRYTNLDLPVTELFMSELGTKYNLENISWKFVLLLGMKHISNPEHLQDI